MPNTSFQKVRRDQVMSDTERKLVRAAQHLVELMPAFTLMLAHRLTKEDHERALPPWFFKLHPFSEKIRQRAEPVQSSSSPIEAGKILEKTPT
jgi:hypothetical protein